MARAKKQKQKPLYPMLAEYFMTAAANVRFGQKRCLEIAQDSYQYEHEMRREFARLQREARTALEREHVAKIVALATRHRLVWLDAASVTTVLETLRDADTYVPVQE